MKNSLSILMTAVLASFITIALFKYFEEPETIIIRERIPATRFPENPPIPQSAFNRQIAPVKTPEPNKEIFENGLRSLVQIKSGKKEWFGKFYSNQVNQNGSGVIISENGYICTNYHVIEGADDIKVVLWNKDILPAEIVGYDAKTDLALLRIQADNLTYSRFGNSDILHTGQKIYALGHPFRMEATVTEGIISGLHRQLGLSKNPNVIESFIQTDAVINPGNSGGALINKNGELIGINTAILTRSGNFEGYSFAIPSNLARKILTDLRTYGYVNRGLLGIRATYQKIPVDNRIGERTSAIRIEEVEKNTPAQWHGLELFDYILSIAGQELTSVNHLKEALWSIEPGRPVSLVYQRDRIIDTLEVTLIQESDNPDYPLLLKFGIEVRNMQPMEIDKYNTHGIRVESIYKESMAETLNLKPGFIITSINTKFILDVKDFYSKFVEAGEDITLAGKYPGEEQTYYYSFNIGHLN
ncbi:trypsin-like peptidase domain-containing protein [Membranicola marinus]|uniref:Trypsin-like peptidase domain-containing protein n=1 Tax=Membranihabitans marinus TaxID=1227546 RepID=A0A953HK05_9BACT|nr:trypsin-like peptidase domain-containing protein [Membranihabitans marinus]MBY5957294.1 trypsin-like peptidase domain-containing protein [Membranihabitans marinus]